MDFSSFIFVTRDNEEIKIPKEFWEKFAFIKSFIGTGYDVKKIEIPSNAPKFGKEHLEIIINFFELAKYNDSEIFYEARPSEALQSSDSQWKNDFFDKLEHHRLFEVIEAANFLGVTDLVDPLAEYIAEKIIQLKTTEEIDDFFGHKMEEEMSKLFNQFAEENEKEHLQQKEKDEEEAEKLKKEEEKRMNEEIAWAENLKEPDAENEIVDLIGLI